MTVADRTSATDRAPAAGLAIAVNLVLSVSIQRDERILKRRRSTPVAAWVLVAGRAVSRWTPDIG